jgi:hypothetical protein
MGIVAGALGSSLESEDACARPTYSEREPQRQAHNQEDPEHDWRRNSALFHSPSAM